MVNIFLLDIDGVLVKPGGYRTALHRTIAFFLQQLELPENFNLTEDEIGNFEAHGITSEWDMIPLTFASLFNQALEGKQHIQLDNLQEAIHWFRVTHPVRERPGYTEKIQEWLRLAKPGLPLADSLYNRLLENPPQHPFRNLATQPFVAELLANTRDFSANPFSRLFQNHVLGKEIFSQFYPGIPAVNVESTLENYDKPTIPPHLQFEISNHIKNGRLRAAAMTLRPNWVKGAALNGNSYRAGFSPEAEIALRLTGLEGIPLAGYGTLLLACQRYQLEIDQILKPSEFHALTAIGLAFTDMQNSLEFSKSLYRTNPTQFSVETSSLISKIIPNEPLNIHIFEDSPNGIRSVIRASEILKSKGWLVSLHLWGITSHPQKRKALQDLGATVFSSTSEAITTALSLIND
ncbi:MAG: hypothetical protein N2646_02820 [Bellilinea sp.]|nr:hypothetical protein [Bellilinea sp.]